MSWNCIWHSINWRGEQLLKEHWLWAIGSFGLFRRSLN